MEVEKIELHGRLRFLPIEHSVSLFFLRFYDKFTPCANTDADRVPAQARFVGCLAQPEIAMVKKAQFSFLIKDGLMLASPFSVIASDTDIIIAIEGMFHVL